MLAEEKSLGEIAKALGRSKSTVSRELRRNATPAYRLYMSRREKEAGQHANRPRKCLGFKKPIEVAAPFVALRG